MSNHKISEDINTFCTGLEKQTNVNNKMNNSNSNPKLPNMTGQKYKMQKTWIFIHVNFKLKTYWETSMSESQLSQFTEVLSILNKILVDIGAPTSLFKEN